MKRNFQEMLNRIEDEEDNNFLDQIFKYQEECLDAANILSEDYIECNEGNLSDVEELIRKIPQKVFVADMNIVFDFIFVFAKFYVEIKKDIPRNVRSSVIDNFLQLNPSDIFVVMNELAFFSKITGALGNEDPFSEIDFFKDVPLELRSSWIVEKQIDSMIENGLILKTQELEEEIEHCIDFLTYCSTMHGVSKKNVAEIRKNFNNYISFGSDSSRELTSQLKSKKINFKCNNEMFFILYFSSVFELVYGMRRNESYELMSALYDLIINPNDPLVDSENKEELIKKRIKRTFGPKAMSGNSDVKKIRAIAKIRVRSLKLIK
ncbi:MAG: hypothetical protein HYV97_14145 [Bdellovibrio sp.]|nr:hypothetical protein [Bdellovibrio sp.]